MKSIVSPLTDSAFTNFLFLMPQKTISPVLPLATLLMFACVPLARAQWTPMNPVTAVQQQSDAVIFAAVHAQTASPIPTQLPGQNAILMGVAWYPEQWPESRWEEDLRLMEAADLKVVRIAEFAWSRMEPSEGHYDLDWLERAINLAAKHHIVSVVGTPTATPPAWLTQKYPDTLRVEPDGQRVAHGTARTPPRRRRVTVTSAAASPSRWPSALVTIPTS